MYTLAPYFMRTRSDAQNAITVTVPYENVHNYVLEARKNGFRVSHLTVVMAALVRTYSQFPQLNRFVVNSKIYAHNELKIAMVVLRPSDSNPSMSKMKFDLYDTIYDVNNKIEAFISENIRKSYFRITLQELKGTVDVAGCDVFIFANTVVALALDGLGAVSVD